jgi:GNAT superfamily N-acetyltransferase
VQLVEPLHLRPPVPPPVEEPYRRQGVATWLLAEGARWLWPAHVDRLLDQAWPSETDRLGFLEASGLRELTRPEKVWTWRG